MYQCCIGPIRVSLAQSVMFISNSKVATGIRHQIYSFWVSLVATLYDYLINNTSFSQQASAAKDGRQVFCPDPGSALEDKTYL